MAVVQIAQLVTVSLIALLIAYSSTAQQSVLELMV